ncbi:MAG: hypothetical protein ACR2M0_01290 [Chloroflexia bacterium]
MLTVASLLGALVVLAFVFAPVWRPRLVPPRAAQHDPGSAAVRALLEQREAALSGLAELDFDHTLGNLSHPDYEDLRGQYRAQAIGVLKALDAATGVDSAARVVMPLPGDSPATAGPGRAAQPVSRRRGLAYTVAAGVLGGLFLAAVLVWARPPAPAPAAVLDVLHVHTALLVPGTEIALVGHHNGLLRSTDSGRTWAAVLTVTGDVLELASAPDTSLLMVEPDGVQRSRDAGLTWQSVPGPPSANAMTAVTAGDKNTLYAQVAGAGVFETTGRGWSFAGGGLPADVAALVWYPAPLSALYAASPTEGVLASGDGGQNWGSANGVVNGALPTSAVRAVAADPASGDTFAGADGSLLQGALYAATDRGLFKSIDGGSSWSALPLSGSLVAVSARSAPSPLLLSVDSRGRVWRSLDRGGSWSNEQ